MVKTLFCSVTMMLTLVISAKAEVQDNNHINKEFRVCPFNVDGLPPTISILGQTININPDGLGEEGAKAIGDYIAKSGIDILALSEDFNYHNALVNQLGDTYQVGTYRGGITSDKFNLDVAFDTDGLEFLTLSSLHFSNESWTRWSKTYGKFDHGNDELIRKGYRHYVVDMGNGAYVDFYTMHMDADTSDEDNAARASQWEQLRDDILANHSNHPIIVMGDTNSRYTRDDINGLFIDPIEQAGNYEVHDAWIELCKNGTYPTLGADPLMVDQLGYHEGEVVDKVIVLNPTTGSLSLTATQFDVDELFDKGDHKPVIVTLKLEGSTFAAAEACNWWRGEEVVGNGQEAYIYNVGKGTFITGKTPTITNIEEASTWTISGSSPYTFACNNATADRISMAYSFVSWSASIKQGSGASSFTLVDATTQDRGKAYKLSVSAKRGGTRYFNVDGNAYTAASTASNLNDWLFISKEQMTAYATYRALYTQALEFQKEELNGELSNQLNTVLGETKDGSYDTYQNDKKKLEAIILEIKDYLKDVNTDIKDVNGMTSSTKPVAIYDIHGVRRNHMTLGINIVKMSNGEVKKVNKTK